MTYDVGASQRRGAHNAIECLRRRRPEANRGHLVFIVLLHHRSLNFKHHLGGRYRVPLASNFCVEVDKDPVPVECVHRAAVFRRNARHDFNVLAVEAHDCARGHPCLELLEPSGVRDNDRNQLRNATAPRMRAKWLEGGLLGP